MYHTWTREALWPSAAAPPPPCPDTTCRIIAELSGLWQGGTVPGLYNESSWQLSRELILPDTAWLYFPYLVGETALYIEDRLWTAGEKSAWVPLIGPGKVNITLKGHGKGGVIGGAYLVARKGNVAWPMNTVSGQRKCYGLDTVELRPLLSGSLLHFRQQQTDKPAWPMWLWGLSMVGWGVAAFVSYPIREAHGWGPWASTPPHPIENILGFGLIGFFIFIIFSAGAFTTLIGIGVFLEVLFAKLLRLPFEKIWQSWIPVLGASWILGHVVSQEWIGWGAWLARSLLVSLYMPRLAYLCAGSLSLYILLFT